MGACRRDVRGEVGRDMERWEEKADGGKNTQPSAFSQRCANLLFSTRVLDIFTLNEGRECIEVAMGRLVFYQVAQKKKRGTCPAVTGLNWESSEYHNQRHQ